MLTITNSGRSGTTDSGGSTLDTVVSSLWIGGSALDETVGSLADICGVDESTDVEEDVISVEDQMTPEAV